MKGGKRLLLGVLMICLSGQAALAEDVNNTLSDIDLGNIIVTTTRQDILLKEAPSKVTLISKDYIESTGQQTLDDVFRYIPGVTMVGSSAYQAMKRQITLRGVPDQSRTLIMVDGIPINSAWQGRVEWGIVPLNCIDKVEIIHGPISALYGSGAMGGVINIFTDMPEESSQTIFNMQYGSLNSKTTQLFQSGKLEKFSYYLGGRFFETDGYIAERNPESYNVKRKRKDMSGLVKLGYELDPETNITVGIMHNDENICRGREYFNIDDQENLGYLKYDNNKVDIQLKGKVYINDQNWGREFDKGPNYNYLNMVEDIDHRYIGTMGEANFALRENNVFTVGIDYKQGDIHLRDEYQTLQREAEANGAQQLVSVFCQDEARFSDERVIATLGVRGDYCKSYDGWCFDTGQVSPPSVSAFSYDYDAKKWTAFSPKAGVVFHWQDDTDIRMSFGRAFHAPDLKQLYLVLARPNKTIYGNSELDPETLYSWEAGLNHIFNNNLTGSLNCYYSLGEDFIDTRTIGTKQFQYDNIEKVNISGVETELKYRINSVWGISLRYTFNRSIIDEDITDPDLNGNYLSLQPQHQASTRLSYENPKVFNLSAILRYVGSMYSDLENTGKLKGYYNFDIQLAKKLNKNIEVMLNCDNIFDKEYSIANSADEDLKAPGRIITGSLMAKW